MKRRAFPFTLAGDNLLKKSRSSQRLIAPTKMNSQIVQLPLIILMRPSAICRWAHFVVSISFQSAVAALRAPSDFPTKII